MADFAGIRDRLVELGERVLRPSRRAQLVELALAGLGVVILLANAASPFLPGSVEDEEPRRGLIADPDAGSGQPADPGFVWVTASAYGGQFLGQETACGETLAAGSRIVAHRDLACGTPLVVRVEDESIAAMVGDRGPFVDGREIDLAPGVWRGLGFPSIDAFGVRGVQVRLIEQPQG